MSEEDAIDEMEDILAEENTESKNKPEPFDSPIPDEQLGHISASKTGLKVGREENNVNAVIHPDNLDGVEIGDYVRVPYYRPDSDDKSSRVDYQLLASVESLSQTTEMNDSRFTSSETFGAEQYTYSAELSPISMINLNDDWDEEDSEMFESGFVSKPPLPTVKVDGVEKKEFLRSGLDVPQDGIYVGDISVNGTRVPNTENPLEYYLFNPNATDKNESDGEPTIFRHVLVAGSTGTGKTHTSKNILRQFAKCKRYTIDIPAEEQKSLNTNEQEREKGLNITIIDPEDEYTEMGENPTDMEKAKKKADLREGVEYGAIGEDTNFQIFAPNTGDSTTKQLNTGTNEVIDFGIPFDIVRSHKEIMMPDNPQGPTRQLINHILVEYFRRKDTYTYDDFHNWLDNDYRITLIEEKDEYSDNIVNAAIRRLIDRQEYEAVFDEGSDSLLDDKILHKMFSPNQVSIVTTGHLRGQSQNLVIQAISSYIVESKISSNPDSTLIKGTPMILGLDEAHEYVEEPETTREKFIVNKFRRAARRGRKDKFGLYFISQNPSDIDGEIRNQINTKIYMRLDARVVNDPNVFVPPEFAGQVTQFDKGQMVVDQPNVEPVEVVGLSVCLTKHSK